MAPSSPPAKAPWSGLPNTGRRAAAELSAGPGQPSVAMERDPAAFPVGCLTGMAARDSGENSAQITDYPPLPPSSCQTTPVKETTLQLLANRVFRRNARGLRAATGRRSRPFHQSIKHSNSQSSQSFHVSSSDLRLPWAISSRPALFRVLKLIQPHGPGGASGADREEKDSAQIEDQIRAKRQA